MEGLLPIARAVRATNAVLRAGHRFERRSDGFDMRQDMQALRQRVARGDRGRSSVDDGR